MGFEPRKGELLEILQRLEMRERGFYSEQVLIILNVSNTGMGFVWN